MTAPVFKETAEQYKVAGGTYTLFSVRIDRIKNCIGVGSFVFHLHHIDALCAILQTLKGEIEDEH